MRVASRKGQAALAVLLSVGFASFTHANTGVQLPLSQYQAGTETTTLVPNGNFETVTGGDAGSPWTESMPGMMTASHFGSTNTNPSVFGNFAAQGGSVDLAEYTQTLAIDPAQNYVLSGYIWNFGNPGPAPHDSSDFDPGDQAVIELVGSTVVQTLLLEPIASDGGNAANGYFVYAEVPAGTFGTDTSVALDVRNDLDTPSGTFPAVVTQFDNVALTPASQFQPPQVPEPGALSLLAAGAAMLLRRRARRS